MKKTLAIPLLVAAALSAGSARAEDDCFVPMADWQPRAAVSRLADERGWIIQRIRIHDGCYRIIGTDARGQPIRVTLHPATLAVLKIDHKDHRKHHRHGEREHGDD